MNLVERVARLICDDGDPEEIRTRTPVHVNKDGSWRDDGPTQELRLWTLYRARARRILEAMREINSGTALDVGAFTQVEVGDEAESVIYAGQGTVEEVWRGIIDAELAADIEQHGPVS